jgi:hypothetical protein
VDRKKRIEKLRAGFETLDDHEKDYLMGIAKALAFASGTAPEAFSPPKPDDRGSEQKKGGRDSMKRGGL